MITSIPAPLGTPEANTAALRIVHSWIICSQSVRIIDKCALQYAMHVFLDRIFQRVFHLILHRSLLVAVVTLPNRKSVLDRTRLARHLVNRIGTDMAGTFDVCLGRLGFKPPARSAAGSEYFDA